MDFCLFRVEFSKIGERDVTVIREMRVRNFKGKKVVRDRNSNIIYIQYDIYGYLEGHQKVSNHNSTRRSQKSLVQM